MPFYQAEAAGIVPEIIVTELFLSTIPYVYYLLDPSPMTIQRSPVRDTIHQERWLCSLPIAGLVYAIIILVFFYPYIGIFTSSLIGPAEDNLQDYWNSWYAQQFYESNSTEFFESNLLFFPEGTSLRYHSFSYSNLALEFALRKLLFLPLSIPVVVSLHNGMLLLYFYLSAIGAYILIRYLFNSPLAGILGGFIFGFSPFHYAHALHHTHVATIQYIPFFVVCFLKYCETRKLRFMLGAVVFYVLSALSSWYYLVYILYFLFFYWIWRAFRERSFLPRDTLFPICQVVGITVLILSPLLVPMIREGIGEPRSYAWGHDYFVADLAGFAVFHPYHLLSSLTEGLSNRMLGNLWEKSVYLGLINLVLVM